MEYRFFSHFLTTYIVVLGGIVGWFIIMFRKEANLIKRKESQQG